MQIFLIRDLPGKGKSGEIITVNDGYARNFVIKNGFGKPVDNATLAHVKEKQASDAFRKATEITAIKETIAKLEKTVVKLTAKVGTTGKLFGSVTGQEVAVELGKLGFNVDKKNLVMEPIKELGSYKIKVKFNHSLTGHFTLEVKNAN